MSKELKYKVGDTVIVVAKIDRVDADDESYREAHGMWFGESDIIGKLPGAKEPEPETKFKVGDKVIHRNKPEWGAGVVESVKHDISFTDYYVMGKDQREIEIAYGVVYPHNVYSSATPWITAEENLTPA